MQGSSYEDLREKLRAEMEKHVDHVDEKNLDSGVKSVYWKSFGDPNYLMRMALGWSEKVKHLSPYSLSLTSTGEYGPASQYYTVAAPIPYFHRPGADMQRAIGSTPDEIYFPEYDYRANHVVNAYFMNLREYMMSYRQNTLPDLSFT